MNVERVQVKYSNPINLIMHVTTATFGKLYVYKSTEKRLTKCLKIKFTDKRTEIPTTFSKLDFNIKVAARNTFKK